MKRLLLIAVLGGAAFVLYGWAFPAPDPYAGLPPILRSEMQRAEKQVKEDMAGDLGQGAIRLCRARLGIKIPVTSGGELVDRGYGAQIAIKFDTCVTDTMYPTPDEK